MIRQIITSILIIPAMDIPIDRLWEVGGTRALAHGRFPTTPSREVVANGDEFGLLNQDECP